MIGEVLGKCRKLETLSLKGNPVQEAQYYREWIVFNCKKLRSLDFERVKEKVRSSVIPSPSLPPSLLPSLSHHFPLPLCPTQSLD